MDEEINQISKKNVTKLNLFINTVIKSTKKQTFSNRGSQKINGQTKKSKTN